MGLVSRDYIRDFHEAEGQGLDAEPIVQTASCAQDLLEALEAVMSWIENWEPSFVEDDEWPADEEKALAAIAKAKAA